MTGRALSEAAKKQKACRHHNIKLAAAVDAYQQDCLRPKDKRKGSRKIAEEFRIQCYRTIERHAKGRPSMSAFNAAKQKLSPQHERVLIDHILESASRGFPPTLKQIHYEAELLYTTLKPEKAAQNPLGHNWVDRFLVRHGDEVQGHWSKPLDMQRANALNPPVMSHWYHNIIKKHVVDKGVEPEVTYGMDESGFPESDTGTERVFGARGTKTQHKTGDGTTLKPTIIYKGQNFQCRWGEDNVAHASIAHSPKGWTDGEIALEWMKDFEEQTREKAAARTRVMFLDGHSSHYTAAVLQFAIAHNIEILAYPPHCTHALQGLDVVCFAKMKKVWKEVISAFEKLHRRKATKNDFTGLFGSAFLEAFTPDTIRAAFSATGIHPFNPDVIKPEQMKPSSATSTQATFPLAQTSPVRAVMATWHYVMPRLDTAEGTAPTEVARPIIEPLVLPGSTPSTPHHNSAPDDDPFGSSPITINTSSPAQMPHSSKRKRGVYNDLGDIYYPPVDPALYTPSKRIRLMSAALSSTASGSFLVSSVRITSAQKIAPPVLEQPPPLSQPNWSLIRTNSPFTPSRRTLEDQVEELTCALKLAKQHIQARDGIIEGAQAQLVVQDLYCMQLNASLFEKENKKPSDRTKLFPEGKGRYLTEEGFVCELERMERERKDRENDKLKRQESRTAKKVAKGALDARWEKMKNEHKKAVTAWEQRCAELVAQGVKKGKLPAKPTRPMKPKMDEPSASIVVDDENETDSSDDK